MLLQELKEKIENKTYEKNMLIFKYEDTDFIPNQYIKEIQKIVGEEVVYVESLSEVGSNNNGFFAEEQMYVYECDKLDSYISYNKDLIIVTKNISKDILKDFQEYITIVPKLEQWMIEDYIKSYCDGLSDSTVKWFLERYNDVYLITEELDKLTLFPRDARESMYKEFKINNVFSPSVNEQSFELTLALQSKNKDKVRGILEDAYKIEIDPIYTLFMLHTSFKKLLKVWLNKNPTPDNTGLKSNQIWAINKQPRVFSREKLISIFEELSSMDTKIKSGEFPIEDSIDYLIVKIMS